MYRLNKNSLDIVYTAMEKIIAILVPDWLRTDFLVGYFLDNSIFYFILILFRIFIDD